MIAVTTRFWPEPVLLVLMGSVTDFAEAIQEHGTRQAVTVARRSFESSIPSSEEGAFQAPQLAQCRGDAVLPRA
jgi:hypothetical protein